MINLIDYDLFIFNNEIGYGTVLQCIDSIPKKEERKKHCFLVLTTPGGNIGTSYKLITSLKNGYDSVNACVIQYCKSAGTFIVLGADRLTMSEVGELGPLDVQIYKRDSVIFPGSGLDPFVTIDEIAKKMFELTIECFAKFAKENIATKLALDSAIALASKSIELTISKSSPYDIGMNARAISIAKEYVDNININNLNDNTLEKLIYNYPDHGFVIDFKQARDLFKNVELLSDKDLLTGLSLLNEYWEHYFVPQETVDKIFKHENKEKEWKNGKK